MKIKMKRFAGISVLLLALTFGVSFINGCAKGGISASAHPQIILKIAPKDAYSLIQLNEGNESFVQIDVRPDHLYSAGHIKDAINISFFEDNFDDEIGKLDRYKTYLINCKTGKCSGKTTALMKKLGFKEVFDVGGIINWKADGLPVVK